MEKAEKYARNFKPVPRRHYDEHQLAILGFGSTLGHGGFETVQQRLSQMYTCGTVHSRHAVE